MNETLPAKSESPIRGQITLPPTSQKFVRFRDIPQFTRSGSYQVNVSWGFLEEHLKSWDDRPRCPLNLDPDFQRAHVWNQKKQIRFVEYILRGGKSSRTIYFNCASWMNEFNTPVELVDGKQRLEAVRAFLHNKIPAFNSYFKEYTDELRWIGPDFLFVMNDLKTRAAVLQWYLDLNEGGVVHTAEELNKVRSLLEAERGEVGICPQNSNPDGARGVSSTKT